MRIEKAQRKRDQLITALKGVYKIAELTHYTSGKLNTAIIEKVYSSNSYRVIPQWTKQYIQGYDAALRDALWKKMIWVLPWNGGLYKSFVELPLEGQKYYNSSRSYGFHIWADDNTKHFTGNKDQFNTGKNMEALS